MTLSLEFKTTVKCCARCQGDHPDLEFKPIDNMDIATHYAICPSNGQPLLLVQSKRRKRKPLLIADRDNFERFWSVYPSPRRKAKEDAWKAYRQVQGDKHLALILAALEWQARSPDWLKDNGDFIPYPATYLRRKRWEDERPMQFNQGKVGMAPPEVKR